MQFVLQFVCLGVGNDMWFVTKVTLCFLDMTLQHLQPGVAQPAECLSRFGVAGIVMLLVDSGG